MCCEVYMQVSNADVQKAVQSHHLLLKTLSRSGNVELVDSAPSDGCISVTASSDTTLHVDVMVSGHGDVVVGDNADGSR